MGSVGLVTATERSPRALAVTGSPANLATMVWKLGAIGALVALQLCLLDGFWNHLDIHLYDGVVHVLNGTALLDGRPPDDWLAWAPLLSFGYGLLGVAGLPLVAMQDTMAAVVSVALVLALWFAVRPFAGAPLSLLLAAAWSATPVALHRVSGTVPTPTHMLAAGLCWLGIGFAVRGRWLAATAAFAAASLERGETALPLAVAGIVAWRVMARRRPALLLLAVAAASLCFHQLYTPSRERAWLTFRQHYAASALQRGEGAAGASFSFPDATIARDFPGATSPLGALWSGPGALARHAADNLAQVPTAASTVLLQPFAHAPWLRWTMLGSFGVVLAWVAVRRARCLAGLLRRHRATLAVLGAGAAATLVPVVLLLPRPDLLLPAAPLFAALAGLVLRAAVRRRERWRWPILGLVAFAAVAAPSPFGPGVFGLREGRGALRLMQRHDFAPGDRLGTVWGDSIVTFAGVPDVQHVNLGTLRRGDDLEASGAAFAASGVNVLVVSPMMFAECGALGAFLANELASDRWEIADWFFPALLYRRVP